jgi:hypothetical protein
MNELDKSKKIEFHLLLSCYWHTGWNRKPGMSFGLRANPNPGNYIVHCNYENLDKWADISTTICKWGGTVL